jgi:HEAT repeats
MLHPFPYIVGMARRGSWRGVAPVADLLTEVDRFREWAGNYPPGPRSGEWECDYGHWNDLNAAVLNYVAGRPPEAWPDESIQAVLYAIARDNECQYLAHEVRLHHPATLVTLARAALSRGEPDAKWQLADELGHLGDEGGEATRLLLLFARDEHEYVRRRALGALARVGSPAVEPLALEAWHRPDEQQEWARMMALDCLHRIGSPHLEPLLAEAERDERQHLRDFAKRIRQGRTD